MKPGENGLSETFGYEGVIAKETIATVFDSGEAFTATNAAGELISAVVNEGDMFVVQNGENYYLLLVTKVLVRDSDNEDSYTFNIKK